LAIMTTGDTVYRETAQPGAILVRVAASHLRVGTFEFAAAFGQTKDLKALADFAITRHYPNLLQNQDKYFDFLKEVFQRQADLIAKWMSIGFIHGVMNTDNMAISGETLDYGPCAFMNTFDQQTVFSSIDRQGRYAYGNQPAIAQWNLARLTESLLPLLDVDSQAAFERGKALLETFPQLYQQSWFSRFFEKLGLADSPHNQELVLNLMPILQEHKLDFTDFFINLAAELESENPNHPEKIRAWLKTWKKNINQSGRSLTELGRQLNSANPKLIPRNHFVEEVLAGANQGDLEPFTDLLAHLQKPFDLPGGGSRWLSRSTIDDRLYRTYCGT
jgi:uncharacterized protein YdiU (UPF0061 family)